MTITLYIAAGAAALALAYCAFVIREQTRFIAILRGSLMSSLRTNIALTDELNLTSDMLNTTTKFLARAPTKNTKKPSAPN